MSILLTSTPASFQTDLLTAICEYLHAQGVGAWHPSGTGYATANNPIYWDVLPADPNVATAASLYTVDDEPGTLSVTGLQLMFRGPPNNRTVVKMNTDKAFVALHGLERVTWAGSEVVRVWRQSTASLGVDGNNRQEATSNFYIQHVRSTPLRTD